MHTKNIITGGKKLEDAKKVLIMIHGRGGSAIDIISLADHLNVDSFALIAPQAPNNTWYPYSFMAASEENEPWLSAALSILKETVAAVMNKGIPSEQIYFLGFSQGACLMLEYLARNAQRYGGAVAFTGGLIGDKIYSEHYKGDFLQTPIFIGTSDEDAHVPITRVYATVNILNNMNASVKTKVYGNMGHTINEDEIKTANEIIFDI